MQEIKNRLPIKTERLKLLFRKHTLEQQVVAIPDSLEIMSVETARRILQTITDFDEESLLLTDSISKINGQTVEEIRKASFIYFEHLAIIFSPPKRHVWGKETNEIFIPNQLTKTLEKRVGNLKLELDLTIGLDKDFNPKEPQTLGLWGKDLTSEPDNIRAVFIRADFPLYNVKNIGWGLQRSAYGFSDSRLPATNNGNFVNLSDFDGTTYSPERKSQRYKFWLLGLRWIFSNMLRWEEPRLIFPEQLSATHIKETVQFPSTERLI